MVFAKMKIPRCKKKGQHHGNTRSQNRVPGSKQSWLYSKLALAIISHNVEGISAVKQDLIYKLCIDHHCDVL